MIILKFKDKTPKRGKIICFTEKDASASFYFIDGTGWCWGKCLGSDEWEYACHWDELSKYGSYSHWARLGKDLNVVFDIPQEDV